MGHDRVALGSEADAAVVIWFLRGLGWGRRAVRSVLGLQRTIYVSDRTTEYRAMWLAAAHAIGGDLKAVSADVYEVTLGDRHTRIANDLVQFDDPVVLQLAGDKSFCYQVAAQLGVPTPGPVTYGRSGWGDAWRHTPLDAACVVKPGAGTGSGVGVTVGVRSRLALADAVALASLHSPRVIVERLIAAETVRLLFLDGEMIHAVRRRGVRVEGDGQASIATLLAGARPSAVPIDRNVLATLAQQGRSTTDVPASGEIIVARWLAADVHSSRELRTIYDEDITDLVAPALIAELAPILSAVGARFAGIDVLTNDPTRSLVASGGVFLEVNTTPGLHHHCRSSASGMSCLIAETVLRRLLGMTVA